MTLDCNVEFKYCQEHLKLISHNGTTPGGKYSRVLSTPSPFSLLSTAGVAYMIMIVNPVGSVVCLMERLLEARTRGTLDFVVFLTSGYG